MAGHSAWVLGWSDVEEGGSCSFAGLGTVAEFPSLGLVSPHLYNEVAGCIFGEEMGTEEKEERAVVH